MSANLEDAPPASVTARGPATLVKAALKQLRPKQWTKNGLLFAALVFSGQFTNLDAVIAAVLGFVAFCFVSSSGYILNDLLDREADRKHPKKRHRPIASGALPVPLAIAEMVCVLALGMAIAGWISPLFLGVTAAYLATTLSYSFWLKHYVILDVMFLSSGFVWRAIAGAIAIDVAVSPWLFLCTAFLALFFGFNKRRGELLAVGEGGGTRKNLAQYSPQMLDQFQAIVTGNVVLSYALYSILGTTPWMVLTLPYVMYVIFRYIYLVDQKGEGEAPDEALIKDRPMLVTAVLFLITAALVVSFAPHPTP